jgi:Ca-activated chloride channel family protein
MLLLLAEFLLPGRARVRAGTAIRGAAPVTALIALAITLGASGASASSLSARRQYEAGKFDEALKEYQQLLSRNPQDARLNFNAGAAAYRDGQYLEALKQFERAASAQDLSLQQQAYYNLGNSLFRLGESLPASATDVQGQSAGGNPANRMAAWEQALRSFQSATNLAPQDLDAKHNYEYVKRKLEELKQQQQEQQQPQQNKDQQKDEQDQSQDQQKQQDQDEKKQQDQEKQSDQKDQNKSDSQDQKKDQQKSPPQDQKSQDPSKQQPKDSEKKGGQQPGEGEFKPGQMTPQQARQLLDAQRSEEQLLRPVAPINDRPPAKDW